MVRKAGVFVGAMFTGACLMLFYACWRQYQAWEQVLSGAL